MSSFLIQLSMYLSKIFSPESMVFLSFILILASFFYLKIKNINIKEVLSVNCPNNIKDIIMISISVVAATFFSQSLKIIFKIPRPSDMLIKETGYSFPSGHATLVFAVCSVCIFLIFKYFKSYNRYINYLYFIIFAFVACAISISRVILHVHRPTDVIAGGLLGIFSAILSIKIYYNIIKYVDKKIFK